MGWMTRQLSGPSDPARDAAWGRPEQRKGFFTDTSICIGCKACEVACKEWNAIPGGGELDLLGTSYDNTGGLGANTWRHVAFVEQTTERVERARESGRRLVDLGMPASRPPDAPHPGASPAGDTAPAGPVGPSPVDGDGDLAAAAAQARTAEVTGTLPDFRWLMASDVCKHCTHAGCLDVCPTGSLFRTEHGTVVVQPDVCNGCGYCVPACPFGVIERRSDGHVQVGHDQPGRAQPGHDHGEVSNVGIAQKCTLCYDRIGVGQTPACAQACPTTSIKFGTLADMLDTAHERVELLRSNGFTEARLYGANAEDGVGGTSSVFLLLDEPEVYGLPPDPVVPTRDLPQMFRSAGIAAVAMFAMAVGAFAGRRR
jgi:formate dehydrogenase iron-sulfur subunit